MRTKESEPATDRKKTIKTQTITGHYIGDFTALCMFSWQIVTSIWFLCKSIFKKRELLRQDGKKTPVCLCANELSDDVSHFKACAVRSDAAQPLGRCLQAMKLNRALLSTVETCWQFSI